MFFRDFYVGPLVKIVNLCSEAPPSVCYKFTPCVGESLCTDRHLHSNTRRRHLTLLRYVPLFASFGENLCSISRSSATSRASSVRKCRVTKFYRLLLEVHRACVQLNLRIDTTSPRRLIYYSSIHRQRPSPWILMYFRGCHVIRRINSWGWLGSEDLALELDYAGYR